MLTIFTPTYNRAYILPRAYEALCSQTSKNFVWLIVDDGSTDNTESLIHTWIQEGRIAIQYHHQENGGKMRAHNLGVHLCETELFVCVDSDDYIVKDAVESILHLWNSLQHKDKLGGIIAYKGKDPSHILFGKPFPNINPATLQELYQNGFTGETTLIYRTHVLSQHLFPVFDGEKFIPEAVVYDQIDQHHPLYVFPRIITICEYHNDGLSHSVALLRENNPKGWLLYYQHRIKNCPCSILRYKYIAHAICFCWKLSYRPSQHIPAHGAEILISLPGALLLKVMKKL